MTAEVYEAGDGMYGVTDGEKENGNTVGILLNHHLGRFLYEMQERIKVLEQQVGELYRRMQ